MTTLGRLFFTLLLLCSSITHAQLMIEVTQGNDRASPVAVSPFKWEGLSLLSDDPAAVIDNDLMLSGMFHPIGREKMLSFPMSEDEVFFRDWQALGATYLITGQVEEERQQVAPAKGSQPAQYKDLYKVTYQLYDIVRGHMVDTDSFSGGKDRLRDLAHRVSDRVYEKITGLPGDFGSRILYVTAQRHNANNTDYQLRYADADGRRARTVFTSKEPVMSPSWAPDGRRISYVSFESGRPAIYIQDLVTSKRQKLTNFRGLNSSPVWSPDGSALAMVLSKDGNSEVYVMDIKSRRLSNITRHWGIDTEPAWMPDGKSLIFSSNRGGGVQIYQQHITRTELGSYQSKGKAERLTYKGSFNARAKVFPDGRSIVMVHKGRGSTDFNIATMDLETGQIRTLTSSKLEDAPSIAPGGRRLIYSVSGGRHGELGIVSIDGRVKQRLPSPVGDVREPAWGPIVH